MYVQQNNTINNTINIHEINVNEIQSVALFRKHLKSDNWTKMGIYQIKPIAQSFTMFMDTILQYFKFSLSKDKNKIQKTKTHKLQNNLKSYIKIQDELYKLKKRSPTPENTNKYKMYKNMNLSKQRNGERDYYHEQFEIHKNDLRMLWKIIKEMTGKVDHCKVKNTQRSLLIINTHQIQK